MKKAVIFCGGVQHLVSEGDVIVVNRLAENDKLEFVPLMIVDGANSIADPTKLSSMTVKAELVAQEQGDKVVALRYKAKKRVMTKRGHRQQLTRLKIKSL